MLSGDSWSRMAAFSPWRCGLSVPVWPLMKAIRASRAHPGLMNGGGAVMSVVPQSGDGTLVRGGAKVTASIGAAMGGEEAKDIEWTLLCSEQTLWVSQPT